MSAAKDETPLALKRCLTMSSRLLNGVVNATDGFTDNVLYASGQFLIQWSPQTKKEILFLDHGSTITAVAFNALTRIGASADDCAGAPRILLWDIATSETLCEIELENPLQCMCFSQEGQNLKERECFKVLVWDLMQGTEGGTTFCGIVPAGDSQTCIELHPSDIRLLITNGNSSVYFWTVEPSRPDVLTASIPTVPFQKNGRYTVSTFMPDGSAAVTASSHGDIFLWVPAKDENAEGVKNERTVYEATKCINVHHGSITVLTTRGSFLVVGGSHGSVSFLDKDLKLESWMEGFGEGSILSISFSNYPTTGCSADDSEFIVGTDKGEIFSSVGEPTSDGQRQILKPQWLQGIRHFDVHPRRPWIATISWAPCELQLFDLDIFEIRVREEIQERSEPTCLIYFRDGSHLSAGFASGRILVLSTEPLSIQAELHNTKAAINHISVSSSGGFLAATTNKQNVLLYQRDESAGLWEFKGKTDSSAKLRNCCFSEDFRGQSRLFALTDAGVLTEVPLPPQRNEMGTLFLKTVRHNVNANAFCTSPPRKYFEKDSTETDMILAGKQSASPLHHPQVSCFQGTDGKLHVHDIVAEQHVRTYVYPTEGAEMRLFGFFQTADVPNGSLTWCVLDQHTVGLTTWPFPSAFPSFCCQNISPATIQSVHVCHDGRQLVTADQNGSVLLWTIQFSAIESQSRLPHEPSDFLSIERHNELRKVYEVLQKLDPEQDGITASQMEVSLCVLGFSPSAAELEDMLSEIETQERRTFDRQWNNRISFAAFESLFVRYAHPIDPQSIEDAFALLNAGGEEIFTVDFMERLESGSQTIQQEVKKLMEQATGSSGLVHNTLYEKDVLDARSLVTWLQD